MKLDREKMMDMVREIAPMIGGEFENASEDMWRGMTQSEKYEVIVRIDDKHGEPQYARLDVNGRFEWKTKRIAEKHAREFKANHMRDAWAQKVE